MTLDPVSYCLMQREAQFVVTPVFCACLNDVCALAHARCGSLTMSELAVPFLLQGLPCHLLAIVFRF
jgi:hypothetical protein